MTDTKTKLTCNPKSICGKNVSSSLSLGMRCKYWGRNLSSVRKMSWSLTRTILQRCGMTVSAKRSSDKTPKEAEDEEEEILEECCGDVEGDDSRES